VDDHARLAEVGDDPLALEVVVPLAVQASTRSVDVVALRTPFGHLLKIAGRVFGTAISWLLRLAS
jgi:hypothetical protein